MTTPLIDQIANAVLYEGYTLYPYRPSSKENQGRRLTVGRIYPRVYSEAQHGAEPWAMQTESLIRFTELKPGLAVRVRFLQPLASKDETGWQEAAERETKLEVSLPATISHPFQFESLSGVVDLSTRKIEKGLFKVTVRILNLTPVEAVGDPDAVLLRTFTSTHTIFQVENGQFVSAFEQKSADLCRNIGCWPVLVGDEARGECHTVLSSPIILPDYPQIAPQLPGDFFDGAEIGDMPALRVQTTTDAEKREMRSVEAHARQLRERTEKLSSE